MQVQVVGYYDHYNIGDEQYKTVLSSLLYQYMTTEIKVNFIDCDKLHSLKICPNDVIVVGGGDVLNEYFIDKIAKKFNGAKNRIIAISVGLPYTGILKNTNKLQIIDYIFCRTQQDIDLFKVYFDESRIFYMPDLSFLLTQTTKLIVPPIESIVAAKKAGRKIASISLSRHIYSKYHIDLYERVIQKLGKFLEYLVQNNFHIVFLPFNNNPDNIFENDEIIHSDVYKILRDRNVTFVRKHLSANQVMDIISQVDVCIPMRFHAILFAVYNNKPFFPIFTTRKVRNLLLDMRWQHAYELGVNDYDLPIDIDMNILCSRFSGFMKSKTLIPKLIEYNKKIQKDINASVSKFIKVLESPDSHEITHIIRKNPDIELIQNTYKIVKNYCISHGYFELCEVTDDTLQNCITGVVSYLLTNGQMNSIYTFGLKSKMFSKETYNYLDEWIWILNDIKTKPKIKLISNPNGLFDIGFIDQIDRSGSHRCGWQYVYENLSHLHNDSCDILDLYVDRTFHWCRDICELIEIIPYKKPWRGFIHHTFDTLFSSYNNAHLLKLAVFQKSLNNCKGLFVLSHYMKKQLINELKVIGFPNVPVHALVHPTEVKVPKFEYKMFIENPNKKLLHVGGWLRNIHSFYELKQETINLSTEFFKSSKFNIKKCAIKGKNMSNYFPQPNFLTNMNDALVNCSTHDVQTSFPKNCSTHDVQTSFPKNCSTHGVQITNNWYKHFLEHTRQQLLSVPLLEHLQNHEYDALLANNIVFINLVDASAVNTLIECIVRNTPILVNRHPAAVEVLGNKYPLFYDSDDICKSMSIIFNDPMSIKNATKYLNKIDKTKFNVNTFVSTLCNLV